ncbi:MAG TPA: branched-chain amino acid ABC transporter permease [Kofleriaceae bacterium]
MTRRRAAFAAAAFGLCLLVPLVVQQDYQLTILFRVVLFAALGLAWNLVGGYAGQLSLGHAAYFGIGAYGLALFYNLLAPLDASGAPVQHDLVALLIALALAVLAAAVAAAVIGSISFRLRGPYFALATIAFAEILHLSAKNLRGITGGEAGVPVPELFARHQSQWFYGAAVLLTALALAITAVIARSRFGYQLQAIREDEDTATACGIDAARTKLVALVSSAALTAVGGALYASKFFIVFPDTVLAIDISNEIAIVAMLGGAGTLTGPIVGAVLLETSAELFKNVFQEAHLLIYGVLIVLVVLFLPEGIVGTAAAWWRRHRS